MQSLKRNGIGAGIAIIAIGGVAAFFVLSPGSREGADPGLTETNTACSLLGISATSTRGIATTTLEERAPQKRYLEIMESCGPHYEGECVAAYAAPATTSAVRRELRTGIVLPIDETFTEDGETWHRIIFTEHIRYPERVDDPWYIKQETGIRVFRDEGLKTLDGEDEKASTTKRIVIDQSEQVLYAYEGDELFTAQSVSTGIDRTPTPRGTFEIFRKTPSRYMQGPIPGISEKTYDLPGVPWDLYFTHQGAVIHGAYWHNQFGKQWSNGCVNLPLSPAQDLYYWADLGTPVIVQE